MVKFLRKGNFKKVACPLFVVLIIFVVSAGIESVFAQPPEPPEPLEFLEPDELFEPPEPLESDEPLEENQADESLESDEFLDFEEIGEFLESEQTSIDIEEGLSKRISLDLRGMDIVDTIKFLAMKGNLNVVTSKNVKGRTTLFLKDVTIADTLDVILLTNKLASERKKNIITVMTEAEYEALYGRKYTDKREIKTLKLNYALPTKIGAALGNIKSSIGKIIMDDATGILILIDTPEKIEEMELTSLELDEGIVEKKPSTVTRVFELEYADAETIKGKVSEALTKDVGSVQSDERTNKLIVRDLPNRMADIEELITAFDTKTREVFIEAKIVEITLDDEFALGVNWDKMFKTLKEEIHFVGSFPVSGITDSFGQMSIGTWKKGFYTEEGTSEEKWHPGTLDHRQTQKIISFLRTVGKVKIISSPHIAVCNNEEAKIMVGTRQPYATSTISQSETAATTSWSAEFVDVGVTLTVTPTINKSGFIRMHIKPEVSTLRDWFEIRDEAGTTQIRLPEVDTSNAETDVLVQDGRTIIIAGLIKEVTNRSEERLPILGDIPVLGGLFRSTSTAKATKELVIFLTPHIISGGEDLLYLEGTEKIRKPKKK